MTMLEASEGAFMTSGGQLKLSLPLAEISAVPVWLTPPLQWLLLLEFRQQRNLVGALHLQAYKLPACASGRHLRFIYSPAGLKRVCKCASSYSGSRLDLPV